MSCCRTSTTRACSMSRCSSTTSPRAGRRITRSPAPASRGSSARGSASTPPRPTPSSWLVEHHLLMSEIAQARDIQDPETAKAFADVVQSPQRLALLMILTACDIRAVGPGVWTGWKGSLLRALYYATEPLLSGGHSPGHPARPHRGARKRRCARRSPAWPAAELETYVGRHYDHYWLRAEPELQVEHARMIRAADAAQQAVRRLDPRQGLRGHHRSLVLYARPSAAAVADRRRLHHGRRLDHRRADLLDPRRPRPRHLPPAPRLHLRRGRKGPRHPHHRYRQAAAAGQAPDPHRPRQGEPPQPAPEAVHAAGARSRSPTRCRRSSPSSRSRASTAPASSTS